MDSYLSKCEQLESYLFALYRQINDCYLEMPHVINGIKKFGVHGK